MRSPGVTDGGSEVADAPIGSDRLAILDPSFAERAREVGIDVNASDHERPEEVALPAFIDPEVWGEKLWREDLFVAEFRLAQDAWLQGERDKFLDPFSLDHRLRTLLVHRDRELLLFCRKQHVGLLFKFEPVFLEDVAQDLRLLARQGSGIGMQRLRHRDIQCVILPTLSR